MYYLHQSIEHDASVLGSECRLQVEYSRLCRDRHRVLDDVDRFFLAHGVKLRMKDDVPESFVESRGRLLDDVTERQIQEAVATP